MAPALSRRAALPIGACLPALAICVMVTCGPTPPAPPPVPAIPWQPASRAELEYDGHGMVLIRAKDRGFVMGGPDSTYGACGSQSWLPAHEVVFTHDFWMDTNEVTWRGFSRVVYASSGVDTGGPPANMAVWWEAVKYCNSRSKALGLDTAYTYDSVCRGCVADLPSFGIDVDSFVGLRMHRDRNGLRLPTEAEFEYACRGGTTTLNYWGDDLSDSVVGQYETTNDTLKPVGRRLPNPYGLHDMTGNAREWTADMNDFTNLDIPHNPERQVDPYMPGPYFRAVARGGWPWAGTFPFEPRLYRSASRDMMITRFRYASFRCVRTHLQ